MPSLKVKTNPSNPWKIRSDSCIINSDNRESILYFSEISLAEGLTSTSESLTYRPSDKAINLLEMQMISPSWSFVELFSNDLESKSIRLNLLSCLATSMGNNLIGFKVS